MPVESELKKIIMKEMHNVPYAGHLGYHKTLKIVKKEFYWPCMNKEVAMYIARCLDCQKFKADHRHPASILHSFPIL